MCFHISIKMVNRSDCLRAIIAKIVQNNGLKHYSFLCSNGRWGVVALWYRLGLLINRSNNRSCTFGITDSNFTPFSQIDFCSVKPYNAESYSKAPFISLI